MNAAMRYILLLAAALLLFVRAQATQLTLDGTLSWQITEPRCSFILKGKLKNDTTSSSGLIRLVLWVTKNPFPSPGGVVAAEQVLGSLPSGFEFESFKVNTIAKVPEVSGDYYFTIAVTETIAGVTRNLLVTGAREVSLRSGDFIGQAKWTVPTTPLFSPAASVNAKNTIILTEKATDLLNAFPADAQTRLKITLKSKSQATVGKRAGGKPVSFKYAVKPAKLPGQKGKIGSIVIDYKGKDLLFKQTQVVLYFQTSKTGFFKMTETGSSKQISWGTFIFKGSAKPAPAP